MDVQQVNLEMPSIDKEAIRIFEELYIECNKCSAHIRIQTLSKKAEENRYVCHDHVAFVKETYEQIIFNGCKLVI